MNRKIDAEAKRLAAKWPGNSRIPLSPAALAVLGNVVCRIYVDGNPEVRCVRR